MTIRELIKELLKDELKLDDEIRFYYKIQDDELVGCFFESVAYRDRVEFTIQEEDYQWHLIKIHLRMKCLYF